MFNPAQHNTIQLNKVHVLKSIKRTYLERFPAWFLEFYQKPAD